MKPDYTYIHDRPVIYRGDTLPPMAVRLEQEDGQKIVPVFVCAQIRSQFGEVVYDYDVRLEDGRVVLDAISGSVTAGFPIGKLLYDIEYRLENGDTHTFICGSITILEDVSRC